MENKIDAPCLMLDARCWIKGAKSQLFSIIQSQGSGIQYPVSSILFSIVIIIFLTACSGKHSKSVKFEQYYIQGEQLYKKNCSNCHQLDGSGLGLVYPPLNKSDYMDKNFESVLCLMKHGVKDSLIVNGKSFVQPMPGIPTLTNLEIAEIATYIYNTWEHNRGIVDVLEASYVLENCKVE